MFSYGLNFDPGGRDTSYISEVTATDGQVVRASVLKDMKCAVII